MSRTHTHTHMLTHSAKQSSNEKTRKIKQTLSLSNEKKQILIADDDANVKY